MEDLVRKVRSALEMSGWESPEIEVAPEGFRVIVTVTTQSFEGLNEAERQARVWEVLDRGLGPADHDRVEFVFPYTPREHQKLAS